MRDDKTEQIERWAKFVRENPNKWKKIHTKFINAIFDKHYQFRERYIKLYGPEKYAELRGIKNKKGYSWLNGNDQ
tara:strand:- start:35316 stop:35540 length:225 start_codon:yes stop_codon:yes gene_type:complete